MVDGVIFAGIDFDFSLFGEEIKWTFMFIDLPSLHLLRTVMGEVEDFDGLFTSLQFCIYIVLPGWVGLERVCLRFYFLG